MITVALILKNLKYIFDLLIVAALVFFYSEWRHTEKEKDFFKGLHDSNITYATKGEMRSAIDSLSIPGPVRNIKEVNNIHTHTETEFRTIIKDSLSGTQQLQCIDWHNGYSSLRGCFQTGIKMDHTDELNVVLHRKPTKKFLFYKYAKKDTLEIYNKDPDSRYTIKSFRRL